MNVNTRLINNTSVVFFYTELRLNESCDDAIQWSVAIPHSTCNDTTVICTCAKGHVMEVDGN